MEILRGLFPDEKDLVLIESRYHKLGGDETIGLLTRGENNAESVKLNKDFLAIAERLLKV